MYDLRRGFQSSEIRFVMLVEDLSMKASNGRQTDLIFLDFSIAFDKVSQSKMIWKLHYYAIQSSVLSWTRAFLADRAKQVGG